MHYLNNKVKKCSIIPHFYKQIINTCQYKAEQLKSTKKIQLPQIPLGETPLKNSLTKTSTVLVHEDVCELAEQTYSRAKTYNIYFRLYAPQTRNKLPKYPRSGPNLFVFLKSRLKTFIFYCCFFRGHIIALQHFLQHNLYLLFKLISISVMKYYLFNLFRF